MDFVGINTSEDTFARYVRPKAKVMELSIKRT